MGLQCTFCHSTVDNFFAPGIEKRLNGWVNQGLNVGRIASLAPNFKPFSDLLGVDVATKKKVLHCRGPGRFDRELGKDGKALPPDGKQAGTLLAPAFGLAAVNLHLDGLRIRPVMERLLSRQPRARLGTFFDRFDGLFADRISFSTRAKPDLVRSKLAST